MDKKAFQRYLATGDYTPSSVPAEDMSLAEHDARWHPNGYKEGDRCLFRANLDKGDKGDADVANATPKEGGISGIFTGSAADYSKPSLMKIGTGEGAQVFGWGLYGSTERGVAEGYARTAASFQGLMNGEVVRPSLGGWEGAAMSAFINEDGNRDKSIKHIETLLKEDDHTDKRWTEKYKQALAWLKNRDNDISLLKENIYEQTFFTNRAPGDESHLMKWWGKMNEEQKQWIIKQSADEGLDVKLDSAFDGEDVYTRVTQACKDKIWRDSNGKIWGEELDNVGAKNASEFLYRAGIDGIKYPVDSYGHKGIKDGNKVGWNYVSFSDDNIRVDRKWRDGEEVDDAARTKIERYLALDASPLDPDFESKHPRGNSGNKGQFRKSEKTLAKLDEADAALSPDGQTEFDPAAEYAAVVAKHKGTPEWMKAPNGEPTNLTEKQWVQVRTPSFKAWFGDWENDPEHASKVTDANGEPMVVFHGSPNGFEVFTGGKENNSSWFAENYAYAMEYTGNQGENGVKKLFLNIRHPFDMRSGDNVVDGYAEISATRHDGGEASPQEIAKIAQLLGTSVEDIKTRFDNTQIWVITQSREFADHLADQGYDGIKFIEMGENTWGTFNPSQIKSATANSGSFSPDKESILDSAPASPSPDGRTVFDQTSTPKK